MYLRRDLIVRLACMKHAASVRPEPGSNSPLSEKFISIHRIATATQISFFVVLEIIRVLAKLLFASANFIAFRSAVSLELTSFAHYARFTLPKISSFAFELTSFSISFSQHCVFLFCCQCAISTPFPLEYIIQVFVRLLLLRYLLFQFRVLFACTLVITLLHHSVFSTTANRWFPHRTF